MTAPTRPVLRYHGGKWRIAPWIIGHFPRHSMYVEPFGGAGSVLMQKSRVSCEVYNDVGDEVVNVFSVMRDPAKARELTRALEFTPFSRIEFIRAHESSADPVERARRAIIRTAMGMGSDAMHRKTMTGFRSKREGQASPAQDFANYPRHVKAFVVRLRYVCIEHLPALAILERYDSPQSLFYADPPYVLSTRSTIQNSKKAYAHEMTDADHEALSERLHAVSGMVVLSGYDCELYRRLYSGWQCSRRQVMADKAVPRIECLWLSPRTAQRLNRRATPCATTPHPVTCNAG